MAFTAIAKRIDGKIKLIKKENNFKSTHLDMSMFDSQIKEGNQYKLTIDYGWTDGMFDLYVSKIEKIEIEKIRENLIDKKYNELINSQITYIDDLTALETHCLETTLLDNNVITKKEDDKLTIYKTWWD